MAATGNLSAGGPLRRLRVQPGPARCARAAAIWRCSPGGSDADVDEVDLRHARQGITESRVGAPMRQAVHIFLKDSRQLRVPIALSLSWTTLFAATGVLPWLTGPGLGVW